VDFSDNHRLGNVKQIVVVFDELLNMRELSSSVVLLLELVSLDLRAHTAVEDYDALLEYLGEVVVEFFDV
jgi:hypothetical protein